MQEFKDGKPNVLQYFTSAKLERLMDFVLVDHAKLEEKRVAYKFPLTAAEILSSPIVRIYEFFGVLPISDLVIRRCHQSPRSDTHLCLSSNVGPVLRHTRCILV